MKKLIWTTICVVLAAAVATLLLCGFIVQETEYVILTQFGRPVRIIEKPGLYWRRPGFLQTVNRFDKRVRVFKTQPIQLLLGDKNPLIMTCYVCWKIAQPQLFFEAVGQAEVASQKMGDMVSSQLGGVLGDYTIANIINTNASLLQLDRIESRILTNCNAKSQLKYGVEIVSVGVSRINYPSIVADAVYKRMQAERRQEAIRYRAEGREAATRIRAEADREAARIVSEASRDAEIAKGKGDSRAMAIYNNAYQKDPEFFEFLKTLDVYRNVIKEDTTLILSTDAALFKYLKQPGEGHGPRHEP